MSRYGSQKWLFFVKSIDRNHMLNAGLEGFYSQSSVGNNPGSGVGIDFISNNQIPGIEFDTLHSYPDQCWLDTHIRDARDVLRKPLLLTEFGKCWKDPGYSSNQRDALFSKVFSKIYWSARNGGAAAGGLFWQLLTEGMDSYRDGHEVLLNEAPSHWSHSTKPL